VENIIVGYYFTDKIHIYTTFDICDVITRQFCAQMFIYRVDFVTITTTTTTPTTTVATTTTTGCIGSQANSTLMQQLTF